METTVLRWRLRARFWGFGQGVRGKDSEVWDFGGFRGWGFGKVRVAGSGFRGLDGVHDSGPLRAVHSSRQKWPGGVVNCCHLSTGSGVGGEGSGKEAAEARHPGGNPGGNRWVLQSTPIQMPPESGGICGILT